MKKLICLVIVLAMVIVVPAYAKKVIVDGERYDCGAGEDTGVDIMLYATRTHSVEAQKLLAPHFTTDKPLTYFEFIILMIPVFDDIIDTAVFTMVRVFDGCGYSMDKKELSKFLYSIKFKTRFKVMEGAKDAYLQYLNGWVAVNE